MTFSFNQAKEITVAVIRFIKDKATELDDMATNEDRKKYILNIAVDKGDDLIKLPKVFEPVDGIVLAQLLDEPIGELVDGVWPVGT